MALRDQKAIGMGGLAGAARSRISAIASVVYGSVLRNSISEQLKKLVPGAEISAGLPRSSVPQLI
ncbi:uncharacterized protein BDR25DRAFT_302415 [Lindgomyces ingoldianus]|uniref:Uncharacterized protein n=1 Tax=Lindgomyces ingoldianus TaxID=673940 RepID=A0ACB6R068_9PLEO|nr:uncharacterized protein BDR25DRAFT_302415 [Lindgomyces ingoldianus]KAF2472699.1 hypothetical protein BDR25DRAFT_302415 [Lindgomyces ingoldianus]